MAEIEEWAVVKQNGVALLLVHVQIEILGALYAQNGLKVSTCVGETIKKSTYMYSNAVYCETRRARWERESFLNVRCLPAGSLKNWAPTGFNRSQCKKVGGYCPGGRDFVFVILARLEEPLDQNASNKSTSGPGALG